MNTEQNHTQTQDNNDFRKCLCDTPLCAKCLSVKCTDKDCPTHTKEAKATWRKNWEKNNNKPFPKPENF